eukprot:2741470-Amphidinium_carterae.1
MASQSDELFYIALTAPAMGSKHSMEIAQATHHGVMRLAGVLESDGNWMTLGWAPPRLGHWVGCYCDDLALVSICPSKKLLKNPLMPPSLGLARERAIALDAKAEQGYDSARFVIKREK